MPGPLFTTNPSEFTRLEGVYIFEQDPPGFISGVFLGVVAVAGETTRGPVDVPVLTEPTEFESIFGPGDSQVRRFLMNKPFGQIVVVRAAAAAAAAAEKDFETFINVAASSPGAWGNDLTVAIEDATDGNANHFNLVVSYQGEVTTYEDLDVTAGNNNLASKLGNSISNLIVVTKLADGRPTNAAAAALDDTAGSDGTIADTDYTGAGRAIEQASAYRGAGIVAVAELANATINAKMLAEAAASSDRMFLIWNGSHTADVTAVVADVANYRSDRIVYAYNSPKTFDFQNGVEITTPPHAWLASVMSQTDVDINPGEESTKRFTAGMSGLSFEALSRNNYVSLREAGIAAFEKDVDGGFLLVSAVTTDLTSGKTQITRRRSADFLQLSAASRLRYFIKKKNTQQNRAQMAAELIAFSDQLRNQGRIVEDFEVDNTYRVYPVASASHRAHLAPGIENRNR